MVLGSAFATTLCWGPELVQIYNDGFVPITGAKHPWALGRPTAEVWPEVWHLNAPLFARARAGETVHVVEAPYALRRRGPDGLDDDTVFTLSFSPVRDEAGAVVTAFEVTDQVAGRAAQAERARLLAEVAAERARLRAVILHVPAPTALHVGPEHRYALVNDAYRRISGGGRDVTGLTVRAAFPELAGQGVFEAIARVYAGGGHPPGDPAQAP